MNVENNIERFFESFATFPVHIVCYLRGSARALHLILEYNVFLYFGKNCLINEVETGLSNFTLFT